MSLHLVNWTAQKILWNMTVEIEERCFLVGCARSGTTLLQSFLASHPHIASFPESHFFANFKPESRLANLLGFPDTRMWPNLRLFSETLEAQGYQVSLPKILWPRSRLPQAFIQCLDDLTAQMNGRIWVEKTPRHILYVDRIERFLPEARFIHIIRDARDVIASLYEVTHEAPEEWGSSGGRSLALCTAQWLRSVKQTLQYEELERHHIVFFDDLTHNTEACLKDICNFLKIEYDPEMISGRRGQVKNLVGAGEFWKAGVIDEEVRRDGVNKKFLRHFSSTEQDYIDEKVASVMATVRVRAEEALSARASR